MQPSSRGLTERAVAQPQHAIRLSGDGIVVRDEQDRRSALVTESAQQRDDLGPGLRVQRAGRLVGEQHARIVRERTRDRHPLALGLGVGVLAAHLFTAQTGLSTLVSPDFTAGVFGWGLAFALGVGLAGAVYPAWRALRLSPIEALRRE